MSAPLVRLVLAVSLLAVSPAVASRARKEAKKATAAAAKKGCGSTLGRRKFLFAGAALVGGAGLAGLGHWWWTRPPKIVFATPASFDEFPHKEWLPEAIQKSRIIVHYETNHFGDASRKGREDRLRRAARGEFAYVQEGWMANEPIHIGSRNIPFAVMGIDRLADGAMLRGWEEPVLNTHSGLVSYDINFRFMQAQRDRAARLGQNLVFPKETQLGLFYKFTELAGDFGFLEPARALLEELQRSNSIRTPDGLRGLAKFVELGRLYREDKAQFMDRMSHFDIEQYFDGQATVHAALLLMNERLIRGEYGPVFALNTEEVGLLRGYPKTPDEPFANGPFHDAIVERFLKARRDRAGAYYLARTFIEAAIREKPLDVHIMAGNSHRNLIALLQKLAAPHKLPIEERTLDAK